MSRRHAVFAPLALVAVALIALGTLVASVVVMVCQALAEGVRWLTD